MKDLPCLTDLDQFEMGRIERHCAVAAFLVSEARSHSLSDALTAELLSVWAAAWWERERGE